MNCQTIPTHNGTRLSSLKKHELRVLLKNRVRDLLDYLLSYNDCPPNRIDKIAAVVEVLNAIAPLGAEEGNGCHKNDVVSVHIVYKEKLP